MLKNIDIKICYKYFDNNYYLRSDPKRIKQVLQNLVSNALKFTDRDGKVHILVQLIKNPNDNPDFLQISVTDSGIGIKKKNQANLFKLFEQDKGRSDNSTQGIGMGLVVSKLICNHYGGDIDFISKYKRGSTFFFKFKLDKDLQNSMIHYKTANCKSSINFS